jgi:bacteriocin-like protein
MSNKELSQIQGGGINATLLNAVARCVSVFYDLGRALGTGIRMAFGKKSC